MKIVKKFLSFSIGTWLGALVGIITIPLMTRLFAPAELGKASMFTLALNVMMLFTMFGIDQAFVRFFYEENTTKLLKKCLKLTFCVYLITLLLIYVFRIEISLYLFGSYDSNIMLLLGMSSLLYALNNYSLSVLRMNQMGWQYSVAQLGMRLFELIFIILFFYLLGKGYSSMVLAKVISIFLVTITAVFLSRKMGQRYQSNAIEKDHSLIEILKFSYPLALTSILNWMLQSVDKMAIKQWSTFEELGVYIAAFRIISILEVIVASFSVYWTPLALERFIKSNYEDNQVFYQKANAFVSFVMLNAAVGLIMFKDALAFLLGKDYREAAVIMPFLVFYPLMYLASETTVMGINFYKKVKWHLFISSSVILIDIASNMLFVPKFGARGAALSIGISYIFLFVLRTHISLRYYKIGYSIKKFYILSALLFGYAIFSSFFTWSIYNPVWGLAIILLSFYLYHEDIQYGLKMYTSKN